jgi:predicted nucleic acid-binding protein
MIYLLDVSALLALLWKRHLNHARAQSWASAHSLAVCPISELGFLRVSCLAYKSSIADAAATLSSWTEDQKPKFFPCDLPVLSAPIAPDGGKTTDFYLCELALRNGAKMATLDERIMHDSAFLIPSL